MHAFPHMLTTACQSLDGDIYSILYDTDLIPSAHCDAMPVNYASVIGPETTVSGLVTTKETADFFVDYIQNDHLGRIANAHCALADCLPDGAKSPACIKLAKLHSTAVDFAKTGRCYALECVLCVMCIFLPCTLLTFFWFASYLDILGIPAKFPHQLIPRKYPDFMQNTLKDSYVSTKILGKIYRSVKELTYAPLTEIPDGSIDKSLVLPGSERYLEDAQVTLLQYNQELWLIMRRYGVEDEQALLSGFVKEFSKKMSNSRSRNGKDQERLDREITHLKREFRNEFWSDVDEEDDYDAMAKVSAWYQVTHEHSTRRKRNEPPPLISFPWVMHDMLCKIKRLNAPHSVQISAGNSAEVLLESEEAYCNITG